MIIFYILGYAIIAGFFIIERYVRKGKDTKNMSRTESDKGSTTLISIVMGIAFILIFISPVLDYFKIGGIYIVWVRCFGVLLGAGGLVIRYAAFSTLGRFFTRILREAENHELVTNGIYKYIRHPGYLSDIMIFIGASMAMGNLICIIVILISFVIAYTYRIKAEEKMLIGIFGEKYVQYQKTSKKLIPFIY
ncbi:MAG: isoprenylcysteine carboxylmethyltransferase family protein [Oscillospiraceae bacterium]|nr:isoprenylcysteine carboxylmethyltransferase family protein [Oscillospiraceae bacterium]